MVGDWYLKDIHLVEKMVVCKKDGNMENECVCFGY